ncbi:5-hydroxytryptamine receptor 2A-like [Sinocyclocheilus anshuiensis]|uniref:5-hydroxytryptamine receptor 2A-like n=1 Tax=Sinocyclocheilus anshuiensis TaxID=1608454 RepID=UPI0007B9A441|nr:PREDICTED: 5-hydroxytryptamine receptor 2A-like [Sinocyclocheilus anshuiensis]
MALNGTTAELRTSGISAEISKDKSTEHWLMEQKVSLGNAVLNNSMDCNGSEDRNRSDPLTSEHVQKNWVALLISLVIIITVTGNILVIMAVSLERKLQNATNYFLRSLAITDMLLGILVMPVAMVTILYGYTWPLPWALCPIWIYLDVLFSTASIMHLCAISLDRYIAIRNPFHHSRSNSLTRARVKITAAWTISVVISMPVPVLGLHDHTKVFRNESCQLTDNNFVLIGSFVAFFIPLIIMVVTYILTISALQSEATLYLDQLIVRPKWSSTIGLLPRGSLSSERLFSRSSLCRDGDSRGSGRRSMQSISNEQKASKVLGVVFLLFVIMWCPFFVTNVMAVVCGSACDEDLVGGLMNVFVWVGYLSSAVNPFIYTLFNKTYRAAFARYMRCRYREERRPLQLILVNTIPPLAYSSTGLPLKMENSLKRRAVGSRSGSFSNTDRSNSGKTQNKQEREEVVSHL